ncbi:MAG: nucleoside-triphosphatase [Clostridia bacterium]|nr:nucleoside-triphosphatase [Clostridia bacterium]
MVKIITGPINSGKTTALINEYKKSGGDGFASLKLMEGDEVNGFDLIRLATGEKRPFIRRSGEEPKGWLANCTLGPYTFSDEAVWWIESVVSDLVAKGVSPLYLDEVGILETDGRCLHETLIKLLESNLDICFTARDKLVDELMDVFKIESAEIISAGERYA